MPNAPPSLFQIFYWKLYRYLTKKGFPQQPMQEKRSWEWIHTRMIGFTLGQRQVHETPFLSDMQPFMAFFFQPPHKHLLRCTHIFWVVNSSVKGLSLTISNLLFAQHLEQHCQYIINFSMTIYYRNEKYQTTYKQIFKGNLLTNRSSNLIAHTFNAQCI